MPYRGSQAGRTIHPIFDGLALMRLKHRSRRRASMCMSEPHHPRTTTRTIGVLLLWSLLSGCGTTSLPPGQSSASAAQSSASAGPPSASVGPSPASAGSTSALPPAGLATTSPPTASPTSPPDAGSSCAGRTLARLSESQRIGQLFLVGLPHDRLGASLAASIRRYHFGSVWSTHQTSVGVAAIRRISDAVQAMATRTTTGGVGFLVAASQEGGLIQALSGPGFDTVPSALEQGALDPTALRTLAARWGRELRAAGVNLDFAPVADIVPPGTDDRNAPIGQLQRAFGHDPATVASHVAAFIRGMRDAGVGTTAKHFPGLGRVTGNTDVTSGVVDPVTTADDPDLRPFARAIRVGVPFVMVSLATYVRIDPDRLAAFSPAIMRGLLRRQLGFTGVVMSDSLTVRAVRSIPAGTRAIRFLRAGGDLIVVGPTQPAIDMATAIARRVQASSSFKARVDDAVLGVLAAKQALGLLACR
jgi:beta-N-acetylhexosaminidase